ncbi:MAG: thioredoxin family protein [Gemmatimonadota bacterium]
MNDEYRAYWDAAYEAKQYLGDEVETHRELWDGIFRKHRTPEWARNRAWEIGGDWKLLVLAEDWCGDASNTVPVLVRFAEALPNVDLRILKRDENLELMDRWLTNGSRSIPLALVLDSDFEPVGRWGPRPAVLQEFVLGEKKAGLRPKEEIYRDARRWYARDNGETTLRELLETLGAARGEMERVGEKTE